MAVFHVVPKVTNASFFAGPGVVPQPGTPAPEPGYNIQLMVNPTAQVGGTVKVDEAKRTVTVTVDATVKNLNSKRIDGKSFSFRRTRRSISATNTSYSSRSRRAEFCSRARSVTL